MVTVVENLEDSTYSITCPEKMAGTLMVVKNTKNPSLFTLQWVVGVDAKEFSGHFTDQRKALEAGIKYIGNMKITQAAKNEYFAQERAKRKTESGKAAKKRD